MHVHVFSPDGEAKIWIEPDIGLAVNKGLNNAEINHILNIVKEREDEIRKSWHKHFSS